MNFATSKLVFVAVSLALVGCSTMNRTPASQSSPEIESKQKAALEASPVGPGDAFKFNEDARFAVGKNEMALGSTVFPQSMSCVLQVEPPRGEFVQNFVPKGMTLTVTSVEVTAGRPTVEIRSWKRAPSMIRSAVQALQQRGYDFSKTPVNYDAKESFISAKDRPTHVVYNLSGSRLASKVVCDSFERSYNSITIYDAKDFEQVDKQILLMGAGVTVGTMSGMVEDRYAGIYGRPTPVDFVALPRPEQQYKLLPINHWQEPRRFEDVKLNSI